MLGLALVLGLALLLGFVLAYGFSLFAVLVQVIGLGGGMAPTQGLRPSILPLIPDSPNALDRLSDSERH